MKTIQLWSSWHWTIFNIWPILYIGDTYEHISTYMSRLKRLKWYSLYNIVYIICIKYAHFVTTIRKVNSILTGFIINLPILFTGPFDKPGHFLQYYAKSDCSYFLKRLFLVKARNTPKLSKPIQGILVTLLALGIHLTIDLKSRQQKVGHLVKLEFQK